MIKAVIIEDEKLASAHLLTMLQQADAGIEVIAFLESVADAIRFFSGQPSVDLIFSDVQLGDGLSFSIFHAVNIPVPVIFITAFDSYVYKAFEKNGIDYLLKPAAREDIQRAIKKYKKLELHFNGGMRKTTAQEMTQLLAPPKKKRMLVKKGVEHVNLLLADIALFYTENKIVFALESNGRKFIVDKTLGELEELLDRGQFFRANRQYLLNIDFVKSYKAYERVKLWVELTVNQPEHSIVISQENAADFRAWLSNA